MFHLESIGSAKMKEDDDAAILVRKARKSYGKKDRKYILDDLDMTVKKGTIYGLLGASGCGKTTLLSTIIGRKSIQSGTVRVLGQPPGMVTKSIGYMPQDIALVGEFTVKGALEHFGWIFGMTDEQIEERYKFLSKLLDLPPAHKLIKELSGGQQRRVSLAVVLVHDPQLLILDEPTVGLDPVLRQKIWDYLVQIAEEKKTIIITTHYIEEAKQAHNIGLMRNGKILAEGKPQTLLDTYGCSTIENVFVHLSRKQMEKMAFAEEKEKTCDDGTDRITDVIQAKPYKKPFLSSLKFTNRGHAKALISKNYFRFKRHPGSLMFAFGFPFLQVSLFFLVVGTFPDDTKVGIVNEEMGNYTNCEDYKLHHRVGGFLLEDNYTCVFEGLACKFLDYMGDKLQNKVYFPSKEEALDEVKKGNIRQMLYFPYNFSKAVTLIRSRTDEFTEEDLDTQEVKVYRDSVDVTINAMVRTEIYETYKRYAESLALDCQTNPHAETIPIVFNEPIHGSTSLTYRDFMAPGMIVVLTSFLAMGVSTLTMITERMEGVWDRTLVAGVSKTEILIFHTITLCCVSFIQIVELFTLSFFIFNLDCKGEKIFAFLLTYLQSIIGICFGILISVVTRNVTEANYASLGLFYPFIILSGCLWPLEGMPNLLRYLSYFVPTTLAVESMSNIIHKGWGIIRFQVFKGFLASMGFIVFFTLASIMILKQEKK